MCLPAVRKKRWGGKQARSGEWQISEKEGRKERKKEKKGRKKEREERKDEGRKEEKEKQKAKRMLIPSQGAITSSAAQSVFTHCFGVSGQEHRQSLAGVSVGISKAAVSCGLI